MEGQELASGGPNRAAMQVVADDTVHASGSAMALGQGPFCVGPPQSLRASLPVDGQHWPSFATRSKLTTLPITANTTSAERVEVLQQMQVLVSPRGMEVLQQQIHVRVLHGKSAGSTSTTTLVAHSINAHRPAE